jgi:ABC-type multidrug transport system ATPase subunit
MINLSAVSLEKRYGQKLVLSGLNFSYSTAVLGVAGSNGSGKSTLLKCLSGLIKPTSGSIHWQFEGHEYLPKQIKPFIGFTAPYVQLYEELTVSENLQFLVELQNYTDSVNIERLLSHFEADNLSTLPYGNLSTGQQQRVKLAAANIKNPPILILDEPGANLDRDGKELVSSLVNRYRVDKKMVIIASNQANELDMCDKILDLKQT